MCIIYVVLHLIHEQSQKMIYFFSITKEELPSVPPFEGLKAFVDWIKLQKAKHKSETVILLAHGGSDHSTFLVSIILMFSVNTIRVVSNTNLRCVQWYRHTTHLDTLFR